MWDKTKNVWLHNIAREYICTQEVILRKGISLQ